MLGVGKEAELRSFLPRTPNIRKEGIILVTKKPEQ